MRTRDLVGLVAVVLAAPGAALAQPSDGVPGVSADAAPLEVGGTALPGGERVGYAESLPVGTLSTAFTAGFGFRSNLLASDHSMSRGVASAALAYSITDFLSAGLVLDGRYDKHSGGGFDDDGWVGEPRLHVRAGKAFGSVAAGAQITVWTPGKDAPSIVPKATSVDARALVSTQLGSGLRLAANAGFRLDNSAKSAENFSDFATTDQASLGVSQWRAAVAGVRLAYPTGKLVIGVESQVDIYVGSPTLDTTNDKPRPSVFVGAGVSYRINPTLTAEVFLSSNIQEKPEVSAMGTIALIPYAPLFAGGVGLQARFGGPKAPGGGGGGTIVKTTCDDPDPSKRPDDCPVKTTCDDPDPSKRPDDCPKLALLTGRVVDDAGAPIRDAKVTITDCDGKAVTVTTDDTGRYKAEGLKPCESTVAIEAAGRQPQSAKLSLAAGENGGTDTALAPLIPPGRIRGLVRSFSTGKGIAAKVEINPGGHVINTAPDGTFEIELPPGKYTVTTSAPGLKSQTREYEVEQKTNVIVNVDLRK